jgi:hypothetical protein
VTGWIKAPTGEKRSFVYEDGHFTIVPSFDASQVVVAGNGIRVFGNSRTAAGLERGFVYDFSWKTNLYFPTFGGPSSTISAGHSFIVVGAAETSSGTMEAFMGNFHTMQIRKLGSLGGANSKALAVNGNYRAVGEAEDSQGRRRAFFFRKGILYDLNNLIDPRAPLILTSAFAINSSDSILAEGSYAGEAVQAYLTLVEPFRDDWRFDLNDLRLQSQDRLANFDSILLNLNGPAGSNYVIQVSTDMVNWEDNSAELYMHETPLWRGYRLGDPKRFFRARQASP